MVAAHLVVDYQNIHLTAHGLWMPGEPVHHALIHPLHYAHQVLAKRNLIRRLVCEQKSLQFEQAELASVTVYRGLPSNEHDRTAYRRSQAQKSEWTRDRRCVVVYRPLKYYRRDDGGFDVKEKGIDVLIALKLVTLAAQTPEPGLVILAAHDTDQEPALEMAVGLAGGRVETTGWMDSKRLRVPGKALWHTQLGEEEFYRSIDRKDYT